MSAITDLFTKPLLYFSLVDVACVTLLCLLVWGLSILLHGFYLGVSGRWRDY